MESAYLRSTGMLPQLLNETKKPNSGLTASLLWTIRSSPAGVSLNENHATAWSSSTIGTMSPNTEKLFEIASVTASTKPNTKDTDETKAP